MLKSIHPSVTSISVTTQPSKTTYIEGETFDPTGMVVTATFNDNTSAVVTGYTYSPSSALATTDTTVTISYGGKTASVSITVNAINLTTVAATDADGSLFGKDASDLQDNIVVGTNAITGTLNYISGYTDAFSGDEANGNFLALKCTAIEGATITVEVVGGLHGPSVLDADGLIVCRIASTEQSIRVIATINGVSQTKTYALTDLVLTPNA